MRPLIVFAILFPLAARAQMAGATDLPHLPPGAMLHDTRMGVPWFVLDTSQMHGSAAEMDVVMDDKPCAVTLAKGGPRHTWRVTAVTSPDGGR